MDEKTNRPKSEVAAAVWARPLYKADGYRWVQPPSHPHLGLCLKEPWLTNTDTCLSMFMEVLFKAANLWNVSGRSSTHEEKKKMQQTYAAQFYAIVRKNESIPFSGN